MAEENTLLKRLAGPSSGKAGLAVDQSEINRIIADVSKGSKFYENEKKKDRELTERINKILKIKEDALQGVDSNAIEVAVDKLLAHIESQRDLSQKIVHVDMDAFYANVEMLDNPSLKGKPFGVGAGVLCTASYEARKFGVRSGMACFVAKKLCPNLIIIELNFARYSEMSDKIMNIFRQYDPQMQVAGCDEGYLNITAYCEKHNVSAEDCVQEMRQKVFEETKLTVSAGIAPNKMLAKICSDKNKPNGQFQLPFDRKEITAFMHDLSIRKVPGIGRVNERLLESIGVKTCGDIFIHRSVLSVMDKWFGLHFLLRTYLGIASNVVQPPVREERKSIGAERTFKPVGDLPHILQKLQEVAAELEEDMERTGWTGRTVTLKYKLDTYQIFTRAKSFNHYIAISKEDLFETGRELLLPEIPLKLRLIGLRVTKLKDLRAATALTGIKRFFESINSDAPNKKRRVGGSETCITPKDDDYRDHEGFKILEDFEDEDAMPGFHEEADGNHVIQDDEAIIDDTCPPKKTHSPISALPRPLKDENVSASTIMIQTKGRRRSVCGPAPIATKAEAEQMHSSEDDMDASEQICPVCRKTLRTNNKWLNAHIDFCLSRGAIREAQAESRSPVKRKGQRGSGLDLQSTRTKQKTMAGNSQVEDQKWT